MALPEDDDASATFCIEKHSKHVLFGGTHVLQTRYYHGQKVQVRNWEKWENSIDFL